MNSNRIIKIWISYVSGDSDYPQIDDTVLALANKINEYGLTV